MAAAALPVARTRGGADDPRGAIARAAAATGVDFRYLLAQARLESSLDPRARAGTSSAAGLYQFTGGTWLRMLDRHGADHGLGWAGAAIEGGRVTTPGMSAAIMALREDADASSLMAAELARDNRAQLAGTLGREPDAAELYLAHFLGADGAGRFLTTLAADPGASAAALLPRAAGANPAIFFAGGAPRSVGQVMALLRGRLANAMGDGADEDEATIVPAGFPPPASEPVRPGAPAWAGSVGRAFADAADAVPATAPPRASMSDTLGRAFGLADEGGGMDGGGPLSADVRAAYGRLKAWGF